MTGQALFLFGLGGIGARVAEPAVQILSRSVPSGRLRVLAVDGDRYGDDGRDRERQPRYVPGESKAVAISGLLERQFPAIEIVALPVYFDARNLPAMLPDERPRAGEGPAVAFLAVDNDASRRILSNFVGSLRQADVVVISASCERQTAGCQIYRRRGGRNLTPPLTLHPEIRRPRDRHPNDLGCDAAQQAGQTQTVYSNTLAAALAIQALYQVLENASGPAWTECYGEVSTGVVRPVSRLTTVASREGR